MERLTKYDNSAKCYLPFSLTDWSEIKIMNKLGELEDVLEKFELTSAEDLRNYLNFKGNMAIWEGELNYKNKIADLEQQLAELKQKAIVPKFQIEQEVWAIGIYHKDCVDNFIIQEICFCSCYGLYYKTNIGIDLFEYYFDIFATKEEAEQSLLNALEDK